MYCALIEFGTPEYADAIALRTEVLRKPLNMEFETDEIAKEYCETHIGSYDGNSHVLLGVLTLKAIDKDVFKMRQVAVKPSHQSKGIGSYLVAMSEQYALINGYETIMLHARINAVPFYKKNNYIIVGVIFQEVGIDHVCMTKKLNT